MIIFSGSIQEPYTDKVPDFRYRKPLPVKHEMEITHILANPPEPYPRWLVGPRPCGKSVVLADYEIRAEDDPKHCLVQRVTVWMMPCAHTQAKEPRCLGEWSMTREFLATQEDFILRQVFA